MDGSSVGTRCDGTGRDVDGHGVRRAIIEVEMPGGLSGLNRPHTDAAVFTCRNDDRRGRIECNGADSRGMSQRAEQRFPGGDVPDAGEPVATPRYHELTRQVEREGPHAACMSSELVHKLAGPCAPDSR